MKKNVLKTISAVTGASVLLAGCAAQAPVEAPAAPIAEAAEAAAPVNFAGELIARETEAYDKVANVQGTFSWDQDQLTPGDEVFNIFGTAATALCAKPGFAFGEVDEENYYINVSGSIKKAQTISLATLKEGESVTRTMSCSCATGPAVANASITGALIADVLDLAEVEEAANTIVFRDAEGYGLPLPLDYVLEKGAMLAWQVGGVDIPTGTQVWMPDTVAKYFTRQVTEIELTCEAEVPDVEGPSAAQRAKLSILNRTGESFSVGDQITFSGYADDCGVAIAAIEFSLDGETWTSCPVESANASKWVCWSFDYVTEAAGTYKLDVRARAADGTVSPLASSVIFTVE